MTFSDVSAQMKKKREEKAPPAPGPRDHGEVSAIRARILAVLISDARQANGRTSTEVAQELGVSQDQLTDWELGQSAPSLPQLEMLAYYLDVPISQFWSDKTLTAQHSDHNVPVDKEHYVELRDHMIGARLAMARQEAKLSQEELANATGLVTETIADYEYGRLSVPFPELTALSSAVHKSIPYFMEGAGRVGGWLQLQEEYRRFSDLPPEVRAFAVQPSNQPFIEIAMRLSKMPLQDLRTVAEKILDITL